VKENLEINLKSTTILLRRD